MIAFIKIPEESSKQLLELINKFDKMTGTRPIYKNQAWFHIVAIKETGRASLVV